jgi:hypothetical protein
MMWTVDDVNLVDGKNYGMNAEKRDRRRWKRNRRDEKEKVRRENWCAFS